MEKKRKNMGVLFFFAAGGMGGAVSQPGAPGWCSGGGEVPDFFFV